MTYLVVGTANNECQIVAVPRAQTAANTARDVRRAGQSQISAESWITVANAMPDIFAPDRNSPSAARLISQSLDTSRFWPVQRAELGGPSHPLVHGAIEIRPGLEIWAFCLTYEGADPVAVYDSVINSIGTPRDAELQAQAEQQDADRSAAQAAADAEAAAAAAQQQQQQHPRRDRHPTTSGTPQSGAMPPPM